MTFDPTKVEMDDLKETASRLLGTKPRERTEEEQRALDRSSRDPKELKKKCRMVDGWLVEVE